MRTIFIQNLQKTLLIGLFSNYISMYTTLAAPLEDNETDSYIEETKEDIFDTQNAYNKNVIIMLGLLALISMGVYRYYQQMQPSISPPRKRGKGPLKFSQVNSADLTSHYVPPGKDIHPNFHSSEPYSQQSDYRNKPSKVGFDIIDEDRMFFFWKKERTQKATTNNRIIPEILLL